MESAPLACLTQYASQLTRSANRHDIRAACVTGNTAQICCVSLRSACGAWCVIC